jgi:hypothetical protein
VAACRFSSTLTESGPVKPPTRPRDRQRVLVFEDFLGGACRIRERATDARDRNHLKIRLQPEHPDFQFPSQTIARSASSTADADDRALATAQKHVAVGEGQVM